MAEMAQAHNWRPTGSGDNLLLYHLIVSRERKAIRHAVEDITKSGRRTESLADLNCFLCICAFVHLDVSFRTSIRLNYTRHSFASIISIIMGQGPSKPGPPTTQMQVLGLGLSRTGTASFSRALEILLQGPSYHGGANLLAGNDSHMRRWNDVLRISLRLRQDPSSVTVAERVFQKFLIAKQLEGFVALSDAPSIMYAEILMELYPDAKIIVTTRDEKKWWKSIEPVVERSDKKSYTNLLFFWVPGLRHWAEYVDLNRYGRYGELYYIGKELRPGPYTYSRHYEYLERVVPKEKLHYYDIKSGWAPLCEILQLPIPDIDFPFENDAAVIQAAFTKAAYLGIGLWAGVITGLTALAVGATFATRHGLTFKSLIDNNFRPLFLSS